MPVSSRQVIFKPMHRLNPRPNHRLKPAAITILCLAGILTLGVAGYRWGYSRPTRPGGVVPIGLSRPPTAVFRIQGHSMAPSLVDGQVCQIVSDSNGFIPGDVVAVQWDSVRRVKRVAATGGDVVDMVNGRLLVNGRRLEDEIADRSPRDFLLPSKVEVPCEPGQWQAHPADADWRVFHYRNPHQYGRETEVVDDYPINTDVRRILNPVDRLAIHISPKSEVDAKEFLVAFFLDGKTHFATTRSGILTAYQTSQSEHRPQNPIELSQLHPIAINIGSDDFHQQIIHVTRQIEYRDAKNSRTADYPLTLTYNELFVVGDNVPISVDSRIIGPVHCEQVIGRVLK